MAIFGDKLFSVAMGYDVIQYLFNWASIKKCLDRFLKTLIWKLFACNKFSDYLS